jgi:hypothetical protein
LKPSIIALAMSAATAESRRWSNMVWAAIAG